MGFTETSLSSEFDHFLLFKERTFWCLSALAGLTVCIPAINSGMGTNCNFFFPLESSNPFPPGFHIRGKCMKTKAHNSETLLLLDKNHSIVWIAEVI